MGISKKFKEYALYKGETFITIGTLEELSEISGIKPKSLMFVLSPAHLKRQNNFKNVLGFRIAKVDNYEDLNVKEEFGPMLDKWNEIYHDVWEDVDYDNCSRTTQNNLKELNKMYHEVKLENKLLKNELLRLFDRLCEKVNYPKKYDMNYLENWLKEQKNES